jgi:hypothetical protein
MTTAQHLAHQLLAHHCRAGNGRPHCSRCQQLAQRLQDWRDRGTNLDQLQLIISKPARSNGKMK